MFNHTRETNMLRQLKKAEKQTIELHPNIFLTLTKENEYRVIVSDGNGSKKFADLKSAIDHCEERNQNRLNKTNKVKLS